MKQSNYICPEAAIIYMEPLDVLAASASNYGIKPEIIETEEEEW